MNRVTFEMINGESFTYDFENTNIEKLYIEIVNAPDGFLEVNHNDETHFLAIEKILRFRIVSNSTIKQREKAHIDAMESISRLI